MSEVTKRIQGIWYRSGCRLSTDGEPLMLCQMGFAEMSVTRDHM